MKVLYGDIWATTEPNGTVNIGFTKQCIDEKLTECFHVVPADLERINAKRPALVLETNDGLQSINSPVSGKVLFFNGKARDFPDRLVEEDIVLTLDISKPAVKKPAKVVNYTQPFVVAVPARAPGAIDRVVEPARFRFIDDDAQEL